MNPSAVNKQRGAALPLTLLLVAFNVTIVVTLLIYATTELNASRNAVNTDAARLMARNGIELAGALIAANSTNNAYVSYQNIITNLPGDSAGRLETKIANTTNDPDAPWKRGITNSTALHSGFATGNDTLLVDLNYASASDPGSGYISPRSKPPGSSWTNLHANMFLMKWVNVYKGDTNSATNLIGRFAFWVDDESTKLNINYSGTPSLYDASWNYKMGSVKTYLPNTRTNLALTNGDISSELNGGTWPLFIDLGGIAGIAHTNMIPVLQARGWPPSYSKVGNAHIRNIFSPYYSLLEIRSANSNVVTTISEQSQLAFTATMFSREPELSFTKGIPRFDMFKFNAPALANATTMQELTNHFIEAINNNYPKFYEKYSLPQFATAIATFYAGPGQTNTFTYSPVGLESGVYCNKARPLINEIDIKINSSLDTSGTNQITTLNVEAELVFLGTARQNDDNNTTRNNTAFDELAPIGSANEGNTNKYSVNVAFSPPFIISGQKVTNVVLKPDPARWFKNRQNTDTNKIINFIRSDSEGLTNNFAVLTHSVQITNQPSSASNVVWLLPQQITANVSYSGDTYQRIAPSIVPNASSAITNYLTNDAKTWVLLHLTSQPRGDLGVRSDPRLGIHAVTLTNAPNSSNSTVFVSSNYTNAAASIYDINKTWRSNSTNLSSGPWSPNYLTDPLSPDITPPIIVFVADRGYSMVNSINFMNHATFMESAADIGEIPITTTKIFSDGSTNYLAWSTPRFWGDGRTNMGDGQQYPPDWLMLDCLHSVYLSPRAHTNRVFTSSTNTNDFNLEHLQHGRVNVNGLKSYFQTRNGTAWRADTIMDSMLVGVGTKNYYDNGLPDDDSHNINIANSFRIIEDGSPSRTNVLNYIHNQAINRAATNNPFLTPFDFVADLAGNTNASFSSLTNSFWMSYVPGSEKTSERRIEVLVKSLQQRLTTRGWQFTVYSLGQALQVTSTGQTNILGESYMQAVWERAPKHDVETGEIKNASPGGAPPMRMLYMRELR
jgi:hypothetical protein